MGMHIKDLHVGYAPYSASLERPGDKRRFPYYAKSRNIKFEIADPKKHYDLVVITGNADISIWGHYAQPRTKVVFDFINSYLAIPRNNWKGRLRGLAKFVSRQNAKLQMDYWHALETMCARADAVVCSTEEQAHDIRPFCKNTHVILDVHTTVTRFAKQQYGADDVFNFVWEGLPVNADSLHLIGEPLRMLQSRYKIALHVVTDLEFNRFLGKYVKSRTADIVRSICDNVYLYEWNEQMSSAIIAACDMAVIPIDLTDPLAAGKPENKLLLFWRMGVPTVVSATPAYKRAMAKAELPMACSGQDEWLNALEHYIGNEEDRCRAGLKGKSVAEEIYSESVILEKWDKVFVELFAQDLHCPDECGAPRALEL
jgi:hypothetical protein